MIISKWNPHPPGPVDIWPVTRPVLAINHTQAEFIQINVLYFYLALLEYIYPLALRLHRGDIDSHWPAVALLIGRNVEANDPWQVGYFILSYTQPDSFMTSLNWHAHYLLRSPRSSTHLLTTNQHTCTCTQSQWYAYEIGLLSREHQILSRAHEKRSKYIF